jgi:D-alanyl-D-alanine carboxypeptidase
MRLIEARIACASRLLLAVLASGLLAAAPAAAGPTMLVEEATGRVIYAEEPDQRWFPASLTKILTAYVVFDAIKAGKVKLETQVPLSEKARGQPATRIGLKAGIPLNVEQALRGLILRSANDFAMALAELVGESEEGFATLMNATAKRLGMTRSHFKNPHGLPDPEQYTTARDMAILAIAVLRDFPERAEMFSTMQFVIHRGTFHSQNDLLRTFEGADGMKTGFTCGAGYNVVATATREGRRMIAVVMGEAQRDERSVRAAALLEHAFATADWKSALGAPRLAQLPFDPVKADDVYDMSRETRTRKCGNPVRRVRAVAALARAKGAGGGHLTATPVAPGATDAGQAQATRVWSAAPKAAAGPGAVAKGAVRAAPSGSAAGGPAN